jgi:photosystem II stability/assembly factor-like uncharacterized protein
MRALTFLLVALPLAAQTPTLSKGEQAAKFHPRVPTPDVSVRTKGYAQRQALEAQTALGMVPWRQAGPMGQGGRVVEFAADPRQPTSYMVAFATGGLWLTQSDGLTWTSLFENQEAFGLGAVAATWGAPGVPATIWLGSGEANASRSTYMGAGVFKSTDGGKTWANMGLRNSHRIGRILLHPSKSDVVLVAAQGPLYSEGGERGVFLTEDGGKSWKQTLKGDGRTGATDLVMDPKNPSVVYAAMWEKDRKAWDFLEGAAGSGIHKSTDGGRTWKRLEGGLPKGDGIGRIGLAISRQDSSKVYAFIDNQTPLPGDKPTLPGCEMYLSTDAGTTWKRTHKDAIPGFGNGIAYWFGQVRVDPTNDQRLFILGVGVSKSEDGGQTWRAVSSEEGSHADHHDLWIDPTNSRHLILGNDGGINVSWDGGGMWRPIKNLPVGQFYTVAVDLETPYRVYGGLQDNGVMMGPATTLRPNQPKDTWKSIYGGDGAFVQVNPKDSNIVYTESQMGAMSRLDLRTNARKSIRPTAAKGEAPLRFNWLTPIHLSPHSPDILYVGTQYVHRSLDRGDTWTRVSPDLTTARKPMVADGGNVPFGTITTLAESPLRFGLLYAGTDDGLVQVSRDGGFSWQNITAGLPTGKWVTRLEASRFQEGTVYVTLTGYRQDDVATYVYKSADFGRTWASLKANLPDEGMNVIREDLVNPDLLFLGSDFGVYASLDGGRRWDVLGATLPHNPAYDMVIQPRAADLVVGTHGRSIFVAPIGVLQKYTSAVRQKPLHLFESAKLRAPRPAGGRGGGGFGGGAPEEPAAFWYHAQAGEATLKLVNEKGDALKTWTLRPTAGLNRLEWDLRLDRVPVAAGTYSLVLEQGGGSAKVTLTVDPAPAGRRPVEDEDGDTEG